MSLSINNILLIGGSGHYCNGIHCRSILTLKAELSLRIAAICDPVNPAKMTQYANLMELIQLDNPIWLFDQDQKNLLAQLNILHEQHSFKIVIIACNPAYHHFYFSWAAEHGISIIGEKPFVVLPNSAWDLSAAREIQFTYEILQKKMAAQKTNAFVSLSKRSHPVFMDLVYQLRKIYECTGQGITYLYLSQNNGIHRLKKEFLRGGAHGYLEGTGTLSHTFYHLIDWVAWLLQNTPGKTKKIKLIIPYIYRVQDYIEQQNYQSLQTYLNTNDVTEINDLPKAVLASEYDYNLQMHLLDENEKVIGLFNLTNYHSGYSDRTAGDVSDSFYPNPNILREGGRMKQLYFEIHQGMLLHLQALRNNNLWEPFKMHFFLRKHPMLCSQQPFVEYFYDDKERIFNSYEHESDQLAIKKICGIPLTIRQEYTLSGFHNQNLTHRIFSLAYELIAYDYHQRMSPHQVVEAPYNIINLEEYNQPANISTFTPYEPEIQLSSSIQSQYD